MTTTVSKLAIAREEAGVNARVVKTLERIRRAFHDLILERDYEEMTVAELCKKAGIGRKTFYMHFSSLEDLMEKQLARMADEYASRIKDLRVPDDLHEITRQFYLYSEEQGPFYERLICGKGYGELGVRLVTRFVSGAWKDSDLFGSLSPFHGELLLCFIHSAGSAMYRQWVESGRKATLDEMVSVSTTLLADGIGGFLRADVQE